MRFGTWIRHATADLPEEVVERVQRDTSEHLRDAGVDPESEVDLVLGLAENMNLELKRLYLTREEWEKFQKGYVRGPEEYDLVRLLGFGVLAFLILVALINGPLSLKYMAAVLSLLALLTVRMHPARQRFWLIGSGWLVFMALYIISPGVNHDHEIFTGFDVLMLGYVVYRLGLSWRLDQRLNRTLRLLEARP